MLSFVFVLDYIGGYGVTLFQVCEQNHMSVWRTLDIALVRRMLNLSERTAKFRFYTL